MRIKTIETTEHNIDDLVNSELSKLGNRVIDVIIQHDAGREFALIKYNEEPETYMSRRSLYE